MPRPVTPADADAVLRMWHVHQRAVLGRPDSTLDDLHEQLADPDLDPASSLVESHDGRVLGCCLVFHDGESGRSDLDVVVDPGEGAHLAAGLVEHGLALCVARGGRTGAARVQVDQGCYRQDTAAAEVLRAAGFTPVTSFHRMRRELTGPVDVHVPPGVALERVDVDDEDALRRAFRLHTSTFEGHFGFVARPWEQWLAAHRARSSSGPLWFAVLDGDDVGFLHETDQFLEDEQAGYVARLGVERVARGRGVAKALLLASFAHLRERGRVAVLLHVDAANASGATALYESVGMRPVRVIDAWRRTVDVP